MDMFASSIYGTSPTYIPAVQPDTALSATDSTQLRRGIRQFVDPGNPLLWVVGIVLVTVGAAGFAGSARVGPVKVGGSVGKS